MKGKCEKCGERDYLECAYNETTGEELYLCEACMGGPQKELNEAAHRLSGGC